MLVLLMTSLVFLCWWRKLQSFLGQLDAETGQLVLNLGMVASKPKQYPCFGDIANYHDGGQLELSVRAAAETVGRDVTEHIGGVGRGVPQVVASPARLTWDVLTTAYHQLGFDITGDEVFKAVVLARIVKPTSKVKARDVLIDLGQTGYHRNTINRMLKRANDREYHQLVARKCHEYVRCNHQVSLVLYDVTTLYFQTPQEDDLRKVGLSKERRVDPQIIVGLITDNLGFPLHIEYFHGKTAEVSTLIPVIRNYLHQHDLASLVVVADAGVLSAANLDALDAAGIDYIVGDRMRKAPYHVAISDDDLEKWSKRTDVYETFDTEKPMGKGNTATSRRVVYGFSPKRYRYDLRSLTLQKQRVEAIIAKQQPVRKPRFLKKTTTGYTLDQKSYDKAQGLAGWKGYITSLDKQHVEATTIISFYHELHHIEQAFRMTKTDLQARPIFQHMEDSIKAHLTIVFTALAVSKHLYLTTGITAPKLIETLNTHRSATITIDNNTIDIPPQINPTTEKTITTLKNWQPHPTQG